MTWDNIGWTTNPGARRSPRRRRTVRTGARKVTRLWPNVDLVNRSGNKILVQWTTLPDGSRMALLMGDNSSVSGTQEIGWWSAIAAAAPAVFSAVKKLAPGLMSKAGELVGQYLPGTAGKLLKGVLAPAAAAGQKAIAQAGKAPAPAIAPKVLPAGLKQALLMSQQRPVKSVRHLATGARIPEGYTKVMPVMRVDQGAFLD